MLTLTNETKIRCTLSKGFSTQWFIAKDGKPVARLTKKAQGWNRWSVLNLITGHWNQFASQEAAMASVGA